MNITQIIDNIDDIDEIDSNGHLNWDYNVLEREMNNMSLLEYPPKLYINFINEIFNVSEIITMKNIIKQWYKNTHNVLKNVYLKNKELKRVMLKVRYKNDEDCSLCLSNMKNTTVVLTPCGHVFHKNCFMTQVSGTHCARHKCSVCRYNMKLDLHKISYMPGLIYNNANSTQLSDTESESFTSDSDDY